MTDRFKFRAWDTDWLRMRYEEDYVIVPDTGNPHWIHGNETIQGEATQLILMQCTGLKDSEGRLIYEGDLVNVKLSSFSCTCEIVFKGMGFWFKDEDGELFVFDPNSYKLTITGNIYETKIT